MFHRIASTAVAALILTMNLAGAEPPKERATLKGSWRPATMALSPDGKLLAIEQSSGDGVVTVLDARSGEKRADLRGHQYIVRSLAFSPDGKSLATGSVDGTVRLWDVQTFKETAVLKHPGCAVRAVAFSPDGQTLAAAAGEKKGAGFQTNLKLWDIDSRRERWSFIGLKDSTTCLAFAPDGRTLYSGGRDGMVRLWDLKAGKETAAWEAVAGGVQTLDASPDGKWLATGGDNFAGKIQLWDVAGRSLRYGLDDRPRGIPRIRFAPGGKLLAATFIRSVIVYDVASGRVAATLPHTNLVQDLAFTPDGKTIVTAGDGVKRWDAPKPFDD